MLLPQALYAADISIDSQTYYAMSQEYNSGEEKDIGTLYEYLSLNVSGESLTFVFAGWGRLETMDERIAYETGDEAVAGFSAAYLDYSRKHSNFNLRFGRQVVLSHGSYESLSGISLRTDLPFHLKISGYAGIPEELEEKSSDDDIVSGGRLSFGAGGRLEIGVGQLEEKDNDVTTRREMSADIWLMPFSNLELYGETVTNTLTDSEAYSSAEAVLYAADNITLSGTYEYIDYQYYFDASEVRIFNYFAADDELRTTGGRLDINVTNNISIMVDNKNYRFRRTEAAAAFGGGIKYVTAGSESDFSFHRTKSNDDTRGGYDEYRAYYMKKSADGVSYSIDGVFDSFENKNITGSDTSLSVTASAGYLIYKDYKVSVDIQYSETSEYDEDTRMFARLEYSFDKAKEAAAPK
jgi:hypothetical protein